METHTTTTTTHTIKVSAPRRKDFAAAVAEIRTIGTYDPAHKAWTVDLVEPPEAAAESYGWLAAAIEATARAAGYRTDAHFYADCYTEV